jgi:hypothetical protein
MIDQKVSSTSDERTANNVMRHEYRILSEEEKAHMKEIKDIGAEFVAMLHRVGRTKVEDERLASRELSLAQTNIEQAVMWAVKHITK